MRVESENAVGKDEKGGNRILVAVLVCLGVIIICLIVAILILWVMAEKDDNIAVRGADCQNKESAQDVNNCIVDTYNEAGLEDGALEVFTNAIEDSVQNENYKKATELIIARSIYASTTSAGCGLALELIDGMDLDAFEAKDKALIYTNAINISSQCSDELQKERWIKKIEEITPLIQGEYYL